MLHLAVAICVLNDIFREAKALAISVDGVAVSADGGFDADFRSTGITYTVDVASVAAPEQLQQLIARVDELAEIPRALRAGARVSRV